MGINLKNIIESNNKGAYLFALLWPIGGLVMSLKNFRTSYSKNLFVIFCVFLGLVFIYNPIGESNADSVRYADQFLRMHYSPFAFSDIFTNLYQSKNSYTDLYQPIVTFLVSRITGNPHYLFMILALVFGYFYSRNIWYIFEQNSNRVTPVLFVFFAAFILLSPIWQINGARMYTALYIFVYGAMPFVFEKNPRKLYWCFLSVFVHFSFLFPLGLLLFYIIIPKKNLTLFFIFFLVTSLWNNVDYKYLRSIFSFLPDFLVYKVNDYTNEVQASYLQQLRGQLTWHVTFAAKASSIFVYTMVLAIYFKGRKKLNEYPELLSLFCFALFFYGCAQVASTIPSGGRFITVARMFMYAVFILYLWEYGKEGIFKTISYLMVPLLLFGIFFSFRIGFEYIGFSIFGNAVTAYLLELREPFIQLIKNLF